MSGAMIFVGFDAAPCLTSLQELRARGADLTPAMAAIGETVLHQAHQAFETGAAPDGSPWEPLKSRQGQILVLTGRLLSSLGQVAGADFAEVGVGVGESAGTAAIYAAIHQFGGKTKAHVIRPRDKKALAWPGMKGNHPVGAVKHPGSNIPARPYIPDEQSLDWLEIEDIIRIYLQGEGDAAHA